MILVQLLVMGVVLFSHGVQTASAAEILSGSGTLVLAFIPFFALALLLRNHIVITRSSDANQKLAKLSAALLVAQVLIAVEFLVPYIAVDATTTEGKWLLESALHGLAYLSMGMCVWSHKMVTSTVNI